MLIGKLIGKVGSKKAKYEIQKVRCEKEVEKISDELGNLIASLPNVDEDHKKELYEKIKQFSEIFGEYVIYEYELSKTNGFFN